MKKIKSDKIIGSTLMEIVIYTFLLLILLGVLTNIFASILDQAKDSASYSEVEVDGKYISQMLYNYVGEIDSVLLPANPGESANSLSFTSGGVVYSFYPSADNLFLTDSVNNDRLNSYSTTVSDFSVTRLGNPGGSPFIKISFTLTSTIIQAKGAETENFTVTAGTR